MIFLKSIFPLPYFIIKIQHIIHIKNKICVNQLFMLLVRLLVNSKLLVVKFGGHSKPLSGFSTVRELVPLTPVLFKGQLYF